MDSDAKDGTRGSIALGLLAIGWLLLAPAAASPQEHERRHEEEGEEHDETALIAEGLRVWTRQCVRCHDIRPTWERRDRSWTVILAHMRARANLTRDQARAVLAYLQAYNEPDEHEEGEEGEEGLPECPDPPPPGFVDRGREVYRGKGRCADCHGPEGTGAGGGPDLTDADWIHGGEFEQIVRVVHEGAPGMPPEGGADLTDDEVCAVAAYVHSLRP